MPLCAGGGLLSARTRPRPSMFKIIRPRLLTFTAVKAWMMELPASFGKNEKLHDGDHWQGGDTWSGEMPSDIKDVKVRDEAKRRLEKAYTSQNVVKEVTDRHVSGVAGHDAIARYAPVQGAEQTVEGDTAGTETTDSASDKAALAANRAVARWAERQALKSKMQQIARVILLDHVDAGLRLWLPPVKLARAAGMTDDEIELIGTEGGPSIPLPEGLTLNEALDLIAVEVVKPGQGVVHIDPTTQDAFGVYLYTAEGSEYLEVSYVEQRAARAADGDTPATEADDRPMTFIATMDASGARTDSTPFDLGGRLTMKTVRRSGGPLITPQVRELQALLNKALTGMNLNLDWAGFLERIFLNAQPPTEQKPDPANPGEFIDVPKPYRTGHGTAMFVQGHEVFDEDDNLKGLTNPSVVIREPSLPVVYIDTADAARRAILHEVYQLHALMSGDAAPSGESRIQAMADFIISLLITAPAVNELGLWLYETVLLFAYALMDEAAPIRTDDDDTEAGSGEGAPTPGEKPKATVRASYRTRIDPGPVSEGMMRQILERVKAGLLSRPSALAASGIQDIDGELALIEQQATLDRVQMRANVVKAFTDAGLSLPVALAEAGYTEDEIKSLMQIDTEPPKQ